MLSADILVLNKENTDELAAALKPEDIRLLISMLNEKIDEIRYTAFLTLQKRSRLHRDVYPYWEELCIKLKNENSYQRSLGIMLLAENIRWDTENRLGRIIETYLLHCEDEKFITSRQTIQSLKVWIADKPEYHELIIQKLINVDISSFKDSQRKLILMDILGVLAVIQKSNPKDKILEYVNAVLTGEKLDKKSKAAVDQLFRK